MNFAVVYLCIIIFEHHTHSSLVAFIVDSGDNVLDLIDISERGFQLSHHFVCMFQSGASGHGNIKVELLELYLPGHIKAQGHAQSHTQKECDHRCENSPRRKTHRRFKKQGVNLHGPVILRYPVETLLPPVRSFQQLVRYHGDKQKSHGQGNKKGADD